MSRVPIASLESATGITAEVDARIKKAVADVPTPFTAIGAHGPAALKTIMPGHGALAAPKHDFKADWKHWSRAERISAIIIIAVIIAVTIGYGLTLVGRTSADAGGAPSRGSCVVVALARTSRDAKDRGVAK